MSDSENRFKKLRAQAEELLKTPEFQTAKAELAKNEIGSLIEDLQIYQAELQAQNEELIEQQEELARSKQQFSNLFDLAPVGYVILDPGGRIVKCNEISAITLAGGRFYSIIDKNFARFISNGLHEFMTWISTQDERPLEIEINGYYKRMWVRLDQRLWKDGGEKFTLLTIIDIHDEVELREMLLDTREELRTLNEELREEVAREVQKNMEQEKFFVRQSHFASMGEMISSISHQWRQPLNVISIIIQDLKEAYLHNELDQKFMDEVVRDSLGQIKHLSTTVDDFKNFFKPEKEKVSFPVQNLLEELERLLKISMRESAISLDILVDENFNLVGFPNELKQALINIVNNAKDAILENRIENGRVEIRAFQSGDKFLLTVSDNGGGIPEDIIHHIFDPYFTTKEDRNGTGIGLYMTLNIVESSLEGNLNCENVNGGARFTLSFPAQVG